MLSGLIDTANRNNEKHSNVQTTRVIRYHKKNMIYLYYKHKQKLQLKNCNLCRHIPIHDHEEHSKSITEPFVLDKTSRKLLFKKRSTTTSYSVRIILS